MKNYVTTGQDDLNSNEIYQLLKAIKEMIKTKSLREEGFEKLQHIDADYLTPHHRIFYYYIKGKYYVLSYKDGDKKDIETLLWGNDCYCDMVAIAFENDIHIKSPKRHFSRAYCKFLLAQAHPNTEIKNKLLIKVQQITDKALGFDPDNGSFLWLQSNL